jgi:hypothetical protein
VGVHMNIKLITAAVALGALGSTASVANASTIEVVLTAYNASGHEISTTTLGLVAGVFYKASFDGFKVVTGTAFDSSAQFSSSLMVSATTAARGETLTVAVIDSGLAPLRPNFVTSYSNNNSPKGWTVTEQTFEGSRSIFAPISGTSTGASYGAGSGAYGGPGVGGPSTIAVSAPYTLEELYTVSLASNAKVVNVNSNSGVTLSYTAVPEASTWLMMLAGFAGIGLVGVSRGNKNRIDA